VVKTDLELKKLAEIFPDEVLFKLPSLVSAKEALKGYSDIIKSCAYINTDCRQVSSLFFKPLPIELRAKIAGYTGDIATQHNAETIALNFLKP